MTAQTAEQTQVTAPGVYDLPADVYHADPVPAGSLSCSGARKLLPPNCPARFAYEREHPPPPRIVFEHGHAAHQRVLGSGPDIVRIDADEWRTNAIKAQVADVRAAGGVPLKPADYDRVQQLAWALRAHPWAARLFNPDRGRPEQSLFWVDQATGVWRRARLDWLTDRTPGARLIVADYKTCVSAAPEHLQRDIERYGYHLQADWYLDAVRALGLAGDLEPAFVFVFQEKDPPHLVTVAQPDTPALRVGRHLNRQALRIYRDCTASGRWPGYSDDVELIPLPAYIENRYAEEIFG
jgi:hypothetical protein